MSKKKKILITTGVAATLFLAYTAGGFWGVPKGINWALNKYATPLIDRTFSTEEIKFNPFTLHLTVKGLSVQKKDVEKPFVKLGLLDTKISWQSLFKLSPILNHLTLDGLDVNIIRTGLSTFNFSDILTRIETMIAENAAKEKDNPKKDDEPTLFALENIQVLNSSVHLDDKFRNRVDSITDLNLAVPLISNFKQEIENPITPKLAFDLNGKPFEADANSLPFTISKKTGANFNFKGVDVNNIVSFVPLKLNAAVTEGELSANLNLAFAEQDEKIHEIKHLRLKGNITIDNLKLENLLNKPEQVASFDKVSVDVGSFALFAHKIDIDKIQIEKPKVLIVRNGAKINLAELANNLIAGPMGEGEQTTPSSTNNDTPITEGNNTDNSTDATAQNKQDAVSEVPSPKENSSSVNSETSGNVTSENSNPASQNKETGSNHNQSENSPQPITATPASKADNRTGTETSEPKAKVSTLFFANEAYASEVKEQSQNVQPVEEKPLDTSKEQVVGAESAPNVDQSQNQKSEANNAPPTDSDTPVKQDSPELKPQDNQSSNSEVAATPESSPVPTPKEIDANNPVSNSSEVNQSGLEQPTERLSSTPENQTAENNSWNWDLNKLEITDGEVTFQDETVGFNTVIKNVNVQLDQLSSQPNKDATLALSLDGLDGNIGAKGTIALFPLNVNLDIQDTNISLAPAQPYIDPFTSAVIKSGQYSDQLKLSVKDEGGKILTNLSGDMTISNIGVALGNEEVIKTSKISVQNLTLGIAKDIQFGIEKLLISGPFADVRLLKTGGVNLAQLAVPKKVDTHPQQKPAEIEKNQSSKVTEEPVTEKTESSSLSWAVNDIGIENGTVHFTDQTNNFSQTISAITLQLKGLDSKHMTSGNIVSSMNLLGGNIGASGLVTLDPIGVNLSLKTNSLNLPLLKPYLEPFTTMQLASAQFSNDGKLEFSLKNNSPVINYKGNAKVVKLKAADKAGQEFASWNSLTSNGINLNVADGISVDISDVVLDSPSFFINKPKKGPMNVMTLMKSSDNTAKNQVKEEKPQKATTKTASTVQKSSDGTVVNISKAQIKNGRLTFVDNGVSPAFRTQLKHLNTTVTKFSTSGAKPFTLKLTGELNDAPISVDGSVNPFKEPLFVDLKAEFKALSMPTLSSYAAGITGYPIKQGMLTLNGDYVIKNNELSSENSIVIHKLEFGHEIPDAKSHLPVGLAVSLLQNRDGVIDLNLPVTGSLNDPQFSVAGIVVKVIVNLITKAVTAPFSLIGSIFGGSSGMDLENIQFLSGSSALDPRTEKELEIIAKAMQDRPGIKFKIFGFASAKEDDIGLKSSKLLRMIQKEVYSDAKGEKKLTQEQINKGINRLFKMADGDRPDTQNIALRKQYLMQSIKITQEDLLNLATRRADRVRAFLTEKFKIAPDRLFVQNPIDNGNDLKPGVKLELQP